MLGHKLYQELSVGFDVWGTIRGEATGLGVYGFYDIERIIGGADAEHMETVERAFDTARPDVVVNAVGVVKQRVSGNDPSQTKTINSEFPHHMARIAAERSARFITISTDCVFSGKKGNYKESDVPDATDTYGVSKRLGEPFGPNILILRTSIIGRELRTRHGLVEWFLSNRGSTVPGYVNAIFSGLTTNAFARVIRQLIAEHTDLDGLYHVSADAISKYDLLLALNDAFATGVGIEASNGLEIDRSLDSSLFRSITGLQPPTWAEMIGEMAADPTPYGFWKGEPGG
jgi:dTDP-4-dehydrorhamnose reductase